MKYLLDTNILSPLLHRQPPPALLGRISAVDVADQVTSSISLGELLYGAHRLAERGHRLLGQIEIVVVRNMRILAFDAAAAQRYGTLRVSLERSGTPIGDADTQIAAIALVHDLTVVTANVWHFERVPGLHIENWLD